MGIFNLKKDLKISPEPPSLKSKGLWAMSEMDGEFVHSVKLDKMGHPAWHIVGEMQSGKPNIY